MITFQQFDENARAALKLLKTTSKIIGGRKVGSLGRVKYKALTTGPSTSAVGLHRQKVNASQAAALKKANFPRSQTGGSRQRFNSTNERNDFTKTAITSYPSQSAYAKDMLPPKELERMYGRGVRSSDQRALYLRRLRRQMGGTRTPRGVHAVDILPRGDFNKNDPTKLITRGKEYHRVVSDIPNEIKNAGGKVGDKIVGNAAEVMSGAKNMEQGRRNRRALYQKVLGATEWDPVTRKQIATVREEFEQFDENARAALKLLKATSKIIGGRKVGTVQRALRSNRAVLSRAERGQTFTKSADKITSGTRSMNITRSSTRKAGFSGGSNINRKDFNTPTKEYSTYPDDLKVDYHPLHNTKVDTNISTLPSGRVAGIQANTTAKRPIRNPSTGRRQVPKTQELVRKLKEYRRRIRRTGGNERNPVHRVDFIPRSDADLYKNVLDKYAMKRARNFRRAQQDLPKDLKAAGAKSKDIVQGTPSIMLKGEGKSGITKRAEMYKNRYGSRVTDLDPTQRTYGVIGSAGGELPPGKRMRTRRPQRRKPAGPKSDNVSPSSAQAMMDRQQRNVF